MAVHSSPSRAFVYKWTLIYISVVATLTLVVVFVFGIS